MTESPAVATPFTVDDLTAQALQEAEPARATFFEKDGQVFQRPVDYSDLELPFHDLRNADDPERTVREMASSIQHTPLPLTGRLVKFLPPAEVTDGKGTTRVDTGVYDGGEISMFYDSMIAKLIVHAPTRAQAIDRMRDALNGFVIRGISSNIPFQAALMQHPRFQSGIFDTGFIAKEYPKGFDASMVPHDDPALLVSVAAYVYRAYTDRSASVSGQLQGHERIVGDHWMVIRLNKEGNEQHAVIARPIDGGYHVEYMGESYELKSDWKLGESLFNGTCNGERRVFTVQVFMR